MQNQEEKGENSMIKEKTIRELVNRVASESGHLLPLNNEAVITYQDLIGHATEEENTELCNDPALNETWYRIYGVAYGTTAAIKWYLNHSNKIAEMQADLEYYKREAEAAKEKIDDAKKAAGVQKANAETLNSQLYECKRDMDGTLKALKAKDDEIIQLKARLYDLMQR